MTRNKPWTGDPSSASIQPASHERDQHTPQHKEPILAAKERSEPSSASSGQLPDIESTARAEQIKPKNGAITNSSPKIESIHDEMRSAEAANSTQPHEPAATLRYVPPMIADEDSEEVLHIYHPEVEDFKAQLDDSLPSAPASRSENRNEQPQAQYPASTQHAAEDEDVFATLGSFLTGSSSDHRANPFGFLDVIGDALAGAFLGDDQRESGRSSQREPVKQDNQRPQDLSPARGNYHASSSGVTLEQQRYLVAECRDHRGVQRRSRLDLNDCLTNDNGQFKWSKGGNFKASARNVVLTDGGQTLQAQLRDCKGRWRSSIVWLTQRISNKNGELILLQ